jgi:hypothetical protein
MGATQPEHPARLGGGFLELSGSTPAPANGFSTLWLPAGRRRACETSAFPSRRRPRASPGGLVELLLADPGGHAVILVEVPEDHFLRRKL